MASTLVNVTTKNPTTGEIKTRTVDYINEHADDSDISALMAALNDLSTNKLTKLEKVSKSDIPLPTV